MKVDVAVMPHFQGLALPAYETELSAGMDLRSAETESRILQPGQRRAIATGIRIAIPRGSKVRCAQGLDWP